MGKPETPECDKLLRVAPDSQKIGEFIEWMNSRKMMICTYVQYDNLDDPRLVPVGKTITDLLADYFEIDLRKVDEEKRSLLEWIREGQQ